MREKRAYKPRKPGGGRKKFKSEYDAGKNLKEQMDIRGVTYIYGMFYRFGLIDVPDEVKEKMGHPKNRKKIGCYVQKSTVLCAVTEEVNLSWEGR